MNKYLLIIVVIFFSLIAKSNTNLDSLINTLDDTKEDTSHINLLLEISYEIGYNDASKALDFATKAFNIANSIQNIDKQFSSLMQMSNCYHILGDYNNGIVYGLKGLGIAENHSDSLKIGRAYNVLGLTYKVMGDHQKAMSYFIQSFEIANKKNNENDQAIIANNIANEYLSLEEYEKSLRFHHIALEIRLRLGDVYGISASYNDMAVVYLLTNKFKAADSLLVIALPMKESIEDKEGVAMVCGNLGILRYEQKKYREGIKLLVRSLIIAEEINALGIVLENYQYLSKSYEKIGSINKGFSYYKLYNNLKDSLKNEDNARSFTQKEMKFDYDKKILADSLKNKQELMLVEEQNKREVQKQKFYTTGGIIGVILLLIIAIILFIGNKKKNEKNIIISAQRDQVEEQKEVLEEQHQEITDSINYAKRIQTALLTEDTEWNKISQEHFILFKPKDVVSGDFFWAFHNPEKSLSIWVAADCTGHGVPGAFMSMLGIGFLNEIIIENNITQTAEILNQLRKKIINALEQKNVDTQQKDGMDLAICVWDKNKDTLEFTGANNPLWLLRDVKHVSEEQKKDAKTLFNKEKTKVIVEYRGNKMPVGVYGKDIKPFTSIIIELQKNDIIYTFSDGYPDQFGGEKGKKLKYKPFKELLLSNYSKPLLEQKQILNSKFEKWKGDLEQIDDVCIIGVRI
jgi:serine phosphatase RsbU (regulator of sigma subunit)